MTNSNEDLRVEQSSFPKSKAARLQLLKGAVQVMLRTRFWLLLAGHAVVFVMSFLFALSLRYDFRIPSAEISKLGYFLVPVVSIKVMFFYASKSFHGWWRYVAFSDLQALGKACLYSFLALALLDYFFLPHQIPRSVLVVDGLLSFVMLGCIRSGWRLLHEEVRPIFSKSKRRKTLLIGTSDTAIRVGHQFRALPQLGHEIIGVVSLNLGEKRQWISSFPVLGNLERLEVILSCHHVDVILVTAGGLTGKQMRELSDLAKALRKPLRVVPRVEDFLMHGDRIPIREIDINDLLGRDPVVLDSSTIKQMIEGEIVLVTGAGGSIGSELCRQILPFRPKVMLALGRGENRIFELERELRSSLGETRLVPIICDINDEKSLRAVFSTHRPTLVVHAAAHKHVPLMEANIPEAVRNNILGTRNVVDCSHEFGVSRFVLISSDKAVNPTSVMGATKHMAERYALSRTCESETKFVVVRFGNVLGSNGSVVPIFQEQIRRGGPITITDARMKRYFMSIPEAAQLVLQAGAQGNGGEIFVLDMGEQILIVDLARDLIRLSGLSADSIEIQFSGMRPGEKLYEELYFDQESSLPTCHPKIFAAYHREFTPSEVAESLLQLEESLYSKESNVRLLRMLQEMIPEFKRDSVEVRATNDDLLESNA